MSNRCMSRAAVAVLAILVASGAIVQADDRDDTRAVTMTNEPAGNALKVYDAGSGALLQTLSTRGNGGVSGNARGIRQNRGELLAAVNYGSNTVAVFRRDGMRLMFEQQEIG